MRKLKNGTINDAECSDILERGDRTLRLAYEQKEREGMREKAHLARTYGEGVWDGRDSQGNKFKHIPIHEVLDAD